MVDASTLSNAIFARPPSLIAPIVNEGGPAFLLRIVEIGREVLALGRFPFPNPSIVRALDLSSVVANHVEVR